MLVQVSTSLCQWPRVVSGATMRKGPGLSHSWRWNSSVLMDCAVLPSPICESATSQVSVSMLRDMFLLHDSRLSFSLSVSEFCSFALAAGLNAGLVH